jgi:hypothetical protein
VLNKGGENWMLPSFARRDGSFGFYDLLTSVPPAARVDNTRLYFGAQNPIIDSQKIIHFAMGIFWKASVHSWSGTEKDPLINLG